MHILIILKDGLGNIFQKGCLTGFRRGYDHSSLSLSDGADQVYDTHGSCAACTFHNQSLIRENRRHIFEIIPSLPLTWVESVDGGYVKKCAEFLALGLDTDISLDDITGL